MARTRDRDPIPVDAAAPLARHSALDVSSLVIAHYAAREHMTYEQIQEVTGLSRATVARRLQHAKKRGFLIERLEVRIPDEPEGLRDAYEREIGHLKLQKALLAQLRDHGVRRVTVVSDHRSPKGDRYVVPRRIGQAAAARLAEAFAARPGIVGINWGWSTMHAIEFLPHPERPNDGLLFVPLIGNLSVDQRHEEQYEEAWACSANRLARLASEVYGTAAPRRLTTPAFVSRKLAPPPVGEGTSAELEVVWKLIHEDISYQVIFGVGHHRRGGQPTHGLVDRMDTIVTGMGALEPTSNLVTMAKLIDPEEVDTLTRAGYVGDLGGSPIRDPGAPPPDEEAGQLAQVIGSLVVSALPDDFVRVARRSRETSNDQRGVFMIGRRPKKAPAFIAACRMGAVNELFTDRATAQEMNTLLGGQAPQK